MTPKSHKQPALSKSPPLSLTERTVPIWRWITAVCAVAASTASTLEVIFDRELRVFWGWIWLFPLFMLLLRWVFLCLAVGLVSSIVVSTISSLHERTRLQVPRLMSRLGLATLCTLPYALRPTMEVWNVSDRVFLARFERELESTVRREGTGAGAIFGEVWRSGGKTVIRVGSYSVTSSYWLIYDPDSRGPAVGSLSDFEFNFLTSLEHRIRHVVGHWFAFVS